MPLQSFSFFSATGHFVNQSFHRCYLSPPSDVGVPQDIVLDLLFVHRYCLGEFTHSCSFRCYLYANDSQGYLSYVYPGNSIFLWPTASWAIPHEETYHPNSTPHLPFLPPKSVLLIIFPSQLMITLSSQSFKPQNSKAPLSLSSCLNHQEILLVLLLNYTQNPILLIFTAVPCSQHCHHSSRLLR